MSKKSTSALSSLFDSKLLCEGFGGHLVRAERDICPRRPPVSRDINYWRLALSGSDSTNSKSIESVGSCKFLEVNCEEDYSSPWRDDCEVNNTYNNEEQEEDSFEKFFTVLVEESDLEKKCKVVEKIRHLLIDDEEARMCMGANGFVEPLLCFLESTFYAGTEKARETGAMALFNLALNNDRNKELMLSSGILPILQRMTASNDSVGAATALYMNLSCLEVAKPVIGTSEIVPFLISILNHEEDVQCKLDALRTLYNISSHPPNISHLLSAGIIDALQTVIMHPTDQTTEKCLAILNYLASSKTAKYEITMAPRLVSGLAMILNVGGPTDQEQAVACLLKLCNANKVCAIWSFKKG